MWSIGIVAHRLALKKVPFSKGTHMERLNAMLNEPSERIDPNFSEELQQFIDLCLTKNPDERPKIH